MALGPFIYGGSTGIRTPQEAAHLRAVAEALASQGRTPHTIGEGLSTIGDAIASRRYRMRGERMESEGRAAYDAKYGDLVKSLISGGGAAAAPVPTAPGGEVPPAPDLSQAHPEYLTGGGMPPPPTMENVANTQLPPAEDLAAIVRTVIGEAGNQSPEGQRAVAEVILNRARESGMTPQQVVMAKGQFEPWSTRAGELNAIDPNSQQYQSVLGNITPAFAPDDPTGGADHFYSPGAQAALGRDAPDWAQGQQGRDIGDQRFYSLGYGGDPGTSGAQDATAAQAAGQPVQTAGLSITGSDEPQPEPRPQQVAASGGFDPRLIDALNDPWAPEGTKAILGALLEQQLKAREPRDPIKVGEHDVLLDPVDHHVIYGGQDAGVADAPKITAITALRKDYENQPGTSRYRQSVPVLTSMAAAVNDTTAMADLDFVYGMAQIFDPESVVRESEMGMVIDSQSMPAAIKGRLEKILNGQASLGPKARRDLVEASRRRVQQYRTQAEGEVDQYGGIADRNHINRQDIMRPLEDMPEDLPPLASPDDPTGTTYEDPTQLPEGTIVEDDHGKQFKITGGKLVPVQ
jgi:hypothetical protein